MRIDDLIDRVTNIAVLFFMVGVCVALVLFIVTMVVNL